MCNNKKNIILLNKFNISKELISNKNLNIFNYENKEKLLEDLQQQKNFFDYLILDLNLLNINDINICNDIKHISYIPIICLFSYKFNDIEKLKQVYFFDDFLIKPFKKENLLKKI